MAERRSDDGAGEANRGLVALEWALRIAEDAGWSATDAHVHRSAGSVLVRLPAAGVVVRVEPPGRKRDAQHQIKVAALLAALHVPAVRVASSMIWESDAGVATTWRWLDAEARGPTEHEIARLARRLHDRSAGENLTDIRWSDPFASTARWLGAPRALGRPERSALQERAAEVAKDWAEAITGRDDAVLTHGDLHAENVLVVGGEPTLIDLETAGRAPALWDLVPAWVHVRRFGASAEQYGRFATAYGADVRTSPVCELMCSAYELEVAAWALACSGRSSRMADEAARRVRDVLQPTPAAAGWRATSEPWSLS